MSNVTAVSPLSAFVIMPFLFCRLRSISRLDFVRLSQKSFLVSKEFISWLIAIMRVSTQLGNLYRNQLLLILNLGSFELFSVDPRCALSLILHKT